ncbi:hypothetical protein [Nocardia sp. NPDC055049]
MAAMLLPLVIGPVGCSGEPMSTGSSSAPEHTSASDGPAAPTASALKDGLVVRSKSDDGRLTYAVVDVDSGALRHTIQLLGKRGTTFSYRAQAYSHDWTHHAVTVATVNGDQHAGCRWSWPRTVRAALTRMVSAGDLERDDATYRLTPRLLSRQKLQDITIDPMLRPFYGDWRLATGHRHHRRRRGGQPRTPPRITAGQQIRGDSRRGLGTPRQPAEPAHRGSPPTDLHNRSTR